MQCCALDARVMLKKLRISSYVVICLRNFITRVDIAVDVREIVESLESIISRNNINFDTYSWDGFQLQEKVNEL